MLSCLQKVIWSTRDHNEWISVPRCQKRLSQINRHQLSPPQPQPSSIFTNTFSNGSIYSRIILLLPWQCCSTFKNSEIVAAAQEERFSRKKHDCAFLRMLFHIAWSHRASICQMSKRLFITRNLYSLWTPSETYLGAAPRRQIIHSGNASLVKEKLFKDWTQEKPQRGPGSIRD